MRTFAAFLLVFLTSPALAQETRPAIPVRIVAAAPSPVVRFALDEKQAHIALITSANHVAMVRRSKDETLWTHASEFPSIDVAFGGEWVIAAMTLASYSAYEAAGGKQVSAVGAPDFLAESTCVAVDPQGRWVWLGSDKDVLQRITPGAVNGWSRRTLAHGGSKAMALASDGEWLAVAGGDKTIRFVNPKSASVDDKKIIEDLPSPALTLAFDAKSSLLASAGEDKSIQLWTVSSQKLKRTTTGHEGIVRALAFDPKGARLASGDDKGAVKLWSVDKGEQIVELPNEGGGAVTDLEFVDKGKALLGACGVNGLRLWDLSKL